MTKWMRNSREVLSEIPNGEQARLTLDLDLQKPSSRKNVRGSVGCEERCIPVEGSCASLAIYKACNSVGIKIAA